MTYFPGNSPRLFRAVCAIWLSSLALLAFSGGLAAAAEAPLELHPDDLANYKPAMRGVFIDAFGTQYRDTLSAKRLVRELGEVDISHAFLQVWVLGEGFFKSENLPRPSGLAVGYHDPLAHIVESLKAETNGKVFLHAWISPLETHNSRAILPPPAGHVSIKHPDWLTEDVEGNRADSNGWHYLDPGHPAVQDHIVATVSEIAKGYDVAGIFIEGLNYPENGSRFGYNPVVLERYRAETGAQGRPEPLDPAWQDWRRQQLTDLLARIVAEAKKINPDLIITASALATGRAPKKAEAFRFSRPFADSLQNWPMWGRYGLVDWICLQDFCDEQTESERFDQWVDFGMASKGQAKLWVGIAGYRNWAIDAFRQVARARTKEADGIGVFNFRQPVRDIAATEDFFAALKAVSGMFESSAGDFFTGAEMAQGLEERIGRMRQAASELTPGPEDGMAPGIEALPVPEPVEPPDAVEKTGAPEAWSSLDSWDRVFLVNRSEFEGHKLGEINGETIFETKTGLIIKIGNQHIERIVRGAQFP